MTTTARRTVGLIMLIAAVLVGAGCIKAKQNILLMPDGSGRMDLTIGYDKAKFDQLGQGQQQEDPTDVNISEWADQSEGFAAFTKPEREEKDGWVTVRFSGYFEDISKVKVSTDEEEQSPVYSFREEGAGHRVQVAGGMTSSMVGQMGAEEIPPDRRQMMLMMFAGFELTEGFTLPGAVSDTTGFPKVDGRSASVTVVDRDLVDEAKLKELAAAEPRVAICGATTVSDGEIAAFRAEMDKAIAAWDQIKADAEAAAATQPAQ